MRAFKVYRSGKRLCLAGLPGAYLPSACVLTAIIDHVSIRGHELTFTVGGLSVAIGEHVRWRRWRLRAGDEVRVRIVESESADAPRTRFLRDPAKELQSQKRYVREIAKRLGWKIQVAKSGHEERPRRAHPP
jgi:hypothetical protein